ncbi:Ribonuclease G [compost metagenome]
MEIEENRNSVLHMLELKMRPDRTQHHILGWTKLGLLELTRKKMREGSGAHLDICNACQGTGRLKR